MRFQGGGENNFQHIVCCFGTHIGMANYGNNRSSFFDYPTSSGTAAGHRLAEKQSPPRHRITSTLRSLLSYYVGKCLFLGGGYFSLNRVQILQDPQRRNVKALGLGSMLQRLLKDGKFGLSLFDLY